MARSLNKAILIGNLGADPEVRSTAGGSRVAQLSLATNRSWTDAEGETHERTEWHRVVAWGKLVDVVEQYLRKGDRVYIEGEIQYRTYEDGEGVTRHATEIRARELLMLGGSAGEGAEEPAPAAVAAGGKPKSAPRKRAAAGAGAARGGGAAVEEDDLPF